jgi:hypothetical protein
MLWGMINVMQLIVHMPLLKVAFPENAVLFYSFIIDISNFDIIPTEKILKLLFSFSASESEEQYKRLGYDSQNIVENLGSMFLFLLGIVLLVCFICLIKHLRARYQW